MTPSGSTPKPICYMVMPFRTKRVEEPRPPGAPAEIDFDELWRRAYMPAIERLGYLPMRADFDPNTAIIKAMLERIAFADLVLADMTIGNGNCYYELGIRHVAKQTHCIVVSADWARPLFDIAQFASVRFPLTDGAIPPAEAEVIRTVLVERIPALKDSVNPYWALLGDAHQDAARRGTFRDFAEQLSAFQSRVSAIRAAPDGLARRAQLRSFLDDLPVAALEIPEVAFEAVALARDIGEWSLALEVIERLPPFTRKNPWVEEQYCLVVSKVGDAATAVGLLETLIKTTGDTPERSGLLGGRYKQLWSAARGDRMAAGASQPSADERKYLGRAIAAYTRGMELDYNEFYCSSNLPNLLRARNGAGDHERATIIDYFVVAACERARSRGSGSEWLRPTLLGAAFRTGDVDRAEALANDIELEGADRWKLQTTLDTLRQAVDHAAAEKREALLAVYDRLASLVGP